MLRGYSQLRSANGEATDASRVVQVIIHGLTYSFPYSAVVSCITMMTMIIMTMIRIKTDKDRSITPGLIYLPSLSLAAAALRIALDTGLTWYTIASSFSPRSDLILDCL